VIRKIDGMPDDIIAVEAVGKVSADDYESIMIPAVDVATRGESRARMLLVFGSDFDGYEAEAALDDAKMGLHHWGDFERIAFVSDHGAQRTAVKGFGFLMPGLVKVFSLSELDEAKSWVVADRP
jgi:hypothetical protein